MAWRIGGGVACSDLVTDHTIQTWPTGLQVSQAVKGQLVDDKLECLYHGWQFDGQGKYVKIPQLPEGAKIPRNACACNYEVRDS
ncbi:hypothetical protein ZWY2020_021624 [Hordeum vulgare]|nr:hypothetical protein ZWY2020_021624 [Hordeum vulgare]